MLIFVNLFVKNLLMLMRVQNFIHDDKIHHEELSWPCKAAL